MIEPLRSFVSRLPLLRQRQTPVLQRLGRSAPVLRHQPTRHSGRRAEKGAHDIFDYRVSFNMT